MFLSSIFEKASFSASKTLNYLFLTNTMFLKEFAAN